MLKLPLGVAREISRARDVFSQARAEVRCTANARSTNCSISIRTDPILYENAHAFKVQDFLSMASQRGLTEDDRRILSEPYNPLYSLISSTPVIVKQYGP